MPKQETTKDSPGSLGSWQNRILETVDQYKDPLARVLCPDKPVEALRFHFLKSSPKALCLKAEVHDACGFFKIFDGEGAVPVYRREKAALASLQSSGLVPRLLAFSDVHHFILTEWLDAPLCVDDHNLSETAFELGVWRAHFDAAAPWEPASGNWFAYLSRFGNEVALDQVEQAEEALSSMPLFGRGLVQNDATLQNFMLSDGGKLIGCDFEKARIRPRGWDYVMTYHSLIERFSKDAEVVLNAFSRGFDSAHRGALITEELNTAARILFCARAMARAA